MGQGRILTRGARVFGALVCAVLGMISLAWIIRDLDKADEANHLWWTWAGMPFRSSGSVFGSSLLDLILLAVYAAVGLTALRSPSAAGALGVAAAVTVAVRLPSLWNLDADWMQGIPDDLKTRAELTAWAGVVLGGLLLATVAAARRPVDPAPPGGPGPGAFADQPPGRPAPGAAATGALFLGAIAAALGAWQIYWAQERGWDIYKHLLSGKHTLITLLAAPAAWTVWAVIALALAATGAALARAPLSRPLGMTAGALLLGDGISEASLYIKLDYVDHIDDLPTVGVLSVLTAFFEALAGLVALLVLARRPLDGYLPPAPAYGGYGTPGGYGGYGDGGPGGPGGYSDGGYGGGYGYGGGAGGYGDSAPGGYGGGYGGGHAPPPTAPPPPAAPPPAPPPGW
ncbi:hypothetical protein HUT19_14055 [Streptomyces sp. NA02950]|uniref:hypothetical protein n=1 Tax=Streptomyces sp. NA02950 TaxID=2742137 RepID=UPI001590BF5A|nr:hypothetical protein [Streptomyces sp. NA02950]QKV92738.1 hypothetical protein HUT19_14055 [Streptomyces sp. NA02950]